METSVTSRIATADDLDVVTETMTLAFAGDPLWGGWAFPDPGRADEQRRAWCRLYLNSALRYPWLRVTDGCEAAALWIPPGGTELSEEEEAKITPLYEDWFGEAAAIHFEGFELFEGAHPRDRPHYYLALLATHPEHRGRGLGMSLLRENLSLIDAEGSPSYLESTNPVNTPKYENLGFVKVGEFTFSNGGPTIETMWREPA
ncbi:MAG: GNAT family N-acetyltransferase [Actinomycetota bacterium]